MLILLVPVLIIGTVTFMKSYNASEGISKMQFVQIAQSLSGMIRIALEKDLRVVSGAAREPEVIEGLLTGDYRQCSKIIRELFNMLTVDYESLAVFDSRGIISANAASREALGIVIADRDYFKAAREGKASVDTMVFSKATGEPIFGICAPVMTASGRFIGGVLGVVKADYLMRYIASLKLGTTGYAFMVDRNGIAIAHPSKDLILKDNINEYPGLSELAKKMTRQQTGAEEYTFRGVKKIAGFSPVEFSGWSIAGNTEQG